MKNMKLNIVRNLAYLRKRHQYSLEKVAEKIGISRQAVSKWEAGETLPDILNCLALADLYDIKVDDLLYFDGNSQDIDMAPKGKHIFGTAVLGERGQIVIPKEARAMLQLKAGDRVVVLGDENPGNQGIALVSADMFMAATKDLLDRFYPGREKQ